MNSLPDELLFSILEYSTYEDLKQRLPLVCKRFNHILQKKYSDSSATTIDKTLRRDSPRKPPINGKVPVILHPCLTDFDYHYTPDINDVKIKVEEESLVGETFEIRKLVCAPFRNENVSTPAACRASVTTETVRTKDNNGWEKPVEFDGTGEGGAVTVLDVMKGVVRAVKEEIWDKDEVVGCYWDGLNGPAEIIDGVLYLKDVWNR